MWRADRVVLSGVVASLALCVMGGTAWAQEGAVSDEEVRQERPLVLIAPMLNFNVGLAGRTTPGSAEKEHRVALNMNGGLAAHYVLNDHIASYIGAVVDMEWYELDEDRTALYIMPMMHVGMSVLANDDGEVPNWLSASFAYFKLYGMLGMRPAPRDRSPSVRLGLGMNSPWVTLAGLTGGAVLPSTLEGIYEVDMSGNRVYMLRVGIGF